MNPIRRGLLSGAVSSATLIVAATAGLLRPGQVLAAPRPARQSPLNQDDLTEALQAMRASQPMTSDALRIKAPEIAEDGANVFIEITSTLPDVDTFAVFVEQNPQRLVAAFQFTPEMLPSVQTRVKLARTSRVWVVARSAGRFYKAITEVKVTVGGCGIGTN